MVAAGEGVGGFGGVEGCGFGGGGRGEVREMDGEMGREEGLERWRERGEGGGRE